MVSALPRACLWCSSLRLRFFLRWSALLCFVWHYGSLVLLTHSNLRFPLRRGLPLGRVRVATACFLGFEVPACDGILSVFVSAPFLCLFHIWNSLSDVLARWVASGFLWCSVWLDFWFFPAAIHFPTRSSSFRPSSGSSLVSFRSSSLWSLLSFWFSVVL